MADIKELRIQVTEKNKFPRLFELDLLKEVKEEMTDEEILNVVKAAAKMGITDIRLTGGDPLERKGLIELVKSIKAVEGIEKVFLTTNGIFLNPVVDDLYKAGVEGVDVQLDTFFQEKYIFMTGGGPIDEAMDGLEGAVRVGMKPVRINATIIKGLNDDEILTFGQLALNEPIDVVFVEKPNDKDVTEAFKSEKTLSFMEIDEIRKKFKGTIKIPSRDMLGEYFKWMEAKGRIGFVSVEAGREYGAEVTAAGEFKTCLLDNSPKDFRNVIAGGNVDEIKTAIESMMGYSN